MKKIAILPTLLTLGNGLCGFASIAIAGKIHMESVNWGVPATGFELLLAAGLILVAMVFDSLDGYAARRTKTASTFGGQLDSLCDAISFGAAPAFLLLRMGQDWDQGAVRRVIAVIAGLYVICAVLRLARFNVESSPDPASHKRFKGLPSPAAAGCIASLALLRAEVSVSWLGLQEPVVQAIIKFAAPLGALLVALLMVSNLPYPHLDRMMRGKRNFGFIVQIVVMLCILVLVRELAMLIIFWAYALNAPIRYVLIDLPRHEPNASVS